MTTAADEKFWQGSKIKGLSFECESLKEDLATAKPQSQPGGDSEGSEVDKDDFEFVNWNNESTVSESSSNKLPSSARFRSSETKTVKNDSSATEVAKLQAKVTHLERSKPEKLPADKLVVSMILDEDHSLDDCKSFEKKTAILLNAIKLHDGNAITKAVLHLANTTKDSLLFNILREQPVAANHYLNYLRIRERFTELCDVLEMLRRSDEATIIKYEMTLQKTNPDAKIKSIETCLQTHFRNRYELVNETKMIEEHLVLLQRQRPIETEDAKVLRAGHDSDFKRYPPKKPLWGSSLLDTLHYCCMYHKGEKDTIFSCPEKFRKDFHLTNKQFSYTLVSALSEQMIWIGIEHEIFIKSYLGKQKLKPEFNLETILEIMYKKRVPVEILTRFASKIEDLETRLETAKMYNCLDVVIETLVLMKNYHALRAFCAKLSEGSRERSLAEEALRRPDVKWKNQAS